MALRVALAEDNFLVRQALTLLLEEAEEIDVVAVCRDADELREALDEHEVDVVVTDIRMPPSEGDEGIRIARELRHSHPEVGVIVLSGYCEVPYALALLEGGSDRRAYLLKDRVHSGRQLVGTIEAVARGGSVIDAKVVETLAASRAAGEGSGLSMLTPREREILVEMARGGSNAAIGDALGMTKRAVEKHINSIFAKLAMPPTADVSRRVRAVLIYLAETELARPDAGPPPPGTPAPP
ncbi:MAG TPA: response regulator transcription factor [Solirubrobacteraceae bacterium]